MKISVRAFITAKSEYDSISKCMDSFSVDPNNGIFAVSDGVSGSLMAKLWAPLLTKTFIKNPTSFFLRDDLGNITLNPTLKLPLQFSNELNKYMELLDFDKRERIQRQIERYNSTGGSRATFIGLQIDGDNAVVQTIGDSITYTCFEDKIKFCTSMAEYGEIQFTQTPQCIASSGEIYGNVRIFNIPLKDGYIYLMTDGIAKWFNNPSKYSENVKIINSIEDHKRFYTFVESQRKELSMDDDDTTLVVLKIEESEKGGLEIIDTYIDNFDSVELEELRMRNIQLSEENDEMNDKIIKLTVEKNNLKEKIRQIQKEYGVINAHMMKLNTLVNEETF